MKIKKRGFYRVSCGNIAFVHFIGMSSAMKFNVRGGILNGCDGRWDKNGVSSDGDSGHNLVELIKPIEDFMHLFRVAKEEDFRCPHCGMVHEYSTLHLFDYQVPIRTILLFGCDCGKDFYLRVGRKNNNNFHNLKVAKTEKELK